MQAPFGTPPSTAFAAGALDEAERRDACDSTPRARDRRARCRDRSRCARSTSDLISRASASRASAPRSAPGARARPPARRGRCALSGAAATASRACVTAEVSRRCCACAAGVLAQLGFHAHQPAQRRQPDQVCRGTPRLVRRRGRLRGRPRAYASSPRAIATRRLDGADGVGRTRRRSARPRPSSGDASASSSAASRSVRFSRDSRSSSISCARGSESGASRIWRTRAELVNAAPSATPGATPCARGCFRLWLRRSGAIALG